MINPKQLYILYLSLKLHFTQKSYNIVEYRGHVKAKPLDERNDRFLFYKWAKKFNTEKEAIEEDEGTLILRSEEDLSDVEFGIQAFAKQLTYDPMIIMILRLIAARVNLFRDY